MQDLELVSCYLITHLDFNENIYLVALNLGNRFAIHLKYPEKMSLNPVAEIPWLRILCTFFWFDGTCWHYQGHIVTATWQGRTFVWEQDLVFCRYPSGMVCFVAMSIFRSGYCRVLFQYQSKSLDVIYRTEPSIPVEWLIPFFRIR